MGAARRVSFYEFRKVPVKPYQDLHYPAVLCKIELPCGRVIKKMVRVEIPLCHDQYDRDSVEEELIRRMRNQVREKYPNPN